MVDVQALIREKLERSKIAAAITPAINLKPLVSESDKDDLEMRAASNLFKSV